MAMLALLAALAALTIRATGIGVFQTQTMHCPGLLPWVGWLLLGLGLGAVALACASMALEGLRRRRARSLGELQDLQVGFAVIGPAMSALALVLFTLRPTACM